MFEICSQNRAASRNVLEDLPAWVCPKRCYPEAARKPVRIVPRKYLTIRTPAVIIFGVFFATPASLSILPISSAQSEPLPALPSAFPFDFPLPTVTFVGPSPLFSYSCALFGGSENVKSCNFNQLHTLSAKHRECGGYGVIRELQAGSRSGPLLPLLPLPRLLPPRISGRGLPATEVESRFFFALLVVRHYLFASPSSFLLSSRPQGEAHVSE
jgi:hypothetical protein